MSTEKRYRGILFLLLSTLLKYALIGGIIGTVALGIINRKTLFNSGFDGLIGGVMAFFLIGCVLGIMVFLFTGFRSGAMESLGEHVGLFGFGLLMGDVFSGGFLAVFISLILRLLIAVFYAVAFMPVTILYYVLMSIIEIFVEIPETLGNITDHLPKILSVILVVVMLFQFLNSI